MELNLIIYKCNSGGNVLIKLMIKFEICHNLSIRENLKFCAGIYLFSFNIMHNLIILPNSFLVIKLSINL